MRRNRKYLAAFAPRRKFVFARNLIDADAVRRRAAGDPAFDRPSDPLGPKTDTGTAPSGTDGQQLRRMIDRYGASRVLGEVGRLASLATYFPEELRDQTFVFVGRLSPEKAVARLIRALAIVRETHPTARLVIVGDGPFRVRLEKLARSMELGDAVLFTGMQSNAPSLMAAAGCFVMSSRYEGQPMVLLEAQVLGLPIVTGRFVTVADALLPGNGLVTASSPAALAQGMIQYLSGAVPRSIFDAEAYNSEALAEFERLVTPDRKK